VLSRQRGVAGVFFIGIRSFKESYEQPDVFNYFLASG